jgi:multiple sugar transport system substrate-binding protein
MNCKEDAVAGIVLGGMAWSEPRGYAPLVACALAWRETKGVEIIWDKRSLQDFESFSVAELARRYDLLVIDHPHVGQATRESCLAPFDELSRAGEREALTHASVGPSWASYIWRGRQWALPIDAAAQVMAWRPDLIDPPPATWDETLALLRRVPALCPMRPPHWLMALFTLAANLGASSSPEGPQLFDSAAGVEAFARLNELMALADSRSFAMDPVRALDTMSAADSHFALAPLIYGYVSYAAEAFRPHRIRFADIAPLGLAGPIGSALGGAGIAVSAMSGHRREAADFCLLARERHSSGGRLRSLGRPAGAFRGLGVGSGQRARRRFLPRHAAHVRRRVA